MKRLMIVGLLLIASPVMAWEFQPMQPGQTWKAPVYQPVQPAPAVNTYNPMNNSWGYEKPDAVNKYNPMEKEWSHEDKDSELKYNAMEDKWEYVEE
jgi:hypothetical protein